MQDTLRAELGEFRFDAGVGRATVERILDIWDAYHLNDMKSGTRRQEQAVKQAEAEVKEENRRDHYGWACDVLRGIPAAPYTIEAEFAARDWECVPCNHHWAEVVAYSDSTQNLSGEARVYCSKCNQRPTIGSAHRPIWLTTPDGQTYDTKEAAEKRAAELHANTGRPTRVSAIGNLYEDRETKPLTPHKYGHDWLVDPLPAEIEAEIIKLFTPPPGTPAPLTPRRECAHYLTAHGITFAARSAPGGKCPLWCDNKNTYKHDHGARFGVTFTRDGRAPFILAFWQSITNGSKPPTSYDVVSAISKHDPGTLEEFCHEYGYDVDSRKTEKTYNAVVAEWNKVKEFFTAAELRELETF